MCNLLPILLNLQPVVCTMRSMVSQLSENFRACRKILLIGDEKMEICFSLAIKSFYLLRD
jgi:predicted solute-binding protein